MSKAQILTLQMILFMSLEIFVVALEDQAARLLHQDQDPGLEGLAIETVPVARTSKLVKALRTLIVGCRTRKSIDRLTWRQES